VQKLQNNTKSRGIFSYDGLLGSSKDNMFYKDL